MQLPHHNLFKLAHSHTPVQQSELGIQKFLVVHLGTYYTICSRLIPAGSSLPFRIDCFPNYFSFFFVTSYWLRIRTILTFVDPKLRPDAREHALNDFPSLGETTPLSTYSPCGLSFFCSCIKVPTDFDSTIPETCNFLELEESAIEASVSYKRTKTMWHGSFRKLLPPFGETHDIFYCP